MAAPAPEIARYQRRVRASETRVWENVLDWEHLPWLHHSSFEAIERIEASRDGWKARVVPRGGREILLELAMDHDRTRYVSRTVEGPGAGSEIWTTVTPVADRETDVEVRFQIPGVSPERLALTGEYFVSLYTRLWDEDEAMMIARQAVLDAGALRQTRTPRQAEISLGPAASLRTRAPVVVEAAGLQLRVVVWRDALYAHSLVCPHLGGPLGDAPVEDGELRCPWHGYRFRLTDGTNPEARGCTLPVAQALHVDPSTGEAFLREDSR